MALTVSDPARRLPNAIGALPEMLLFFSSTMAAARCRPSPEMGPVSAGTRKFRASRVVPRATSRGKAKKESASRERLCRVNREASNRVDRSHSNPDDWTVKLRPVKLKQWLTRPAQSSDSLPEIASDRLIPERQQPSALEKGGGDVGARLLRADGAFNPLDLGFQQPDPHFELVERQRRQVLAELVGGLLFLRRFVVDERHRSAPGTGNQISVIGNELQGSGRRRPKAA